MNQPARWIPVALLLLALVAAPASAACGDCADTKCCCGKTGGCSKPADPDARRAKCCDGTVAPTREAVGLSDAPPPVSAEESLGAPAITGAVPFDLDREPDASGARSSPVGLYTLHAAFLI